MITIHHATYWDILLVPIYLFLFYLIAYNIKNKYYKHDPYLGKKLLLGFWLKALAAIFYVLLIQFYYGYGDSFGYSGFSQIMHKAITDDPSNLRFFFLHETEPFSDYLKSIDVTQYSLTPEYMFNNLGNQAIVKFDCFFGFFCFQNYTVVSLMFTLLSYIGVWKIYILLDKVFRSYRKYVVFSFLMLPSFVFWCSGILKEAICIYAEGIICFIVFRFIFEKKLSLKKIILFGICAYLLILIKSYILLAIMGGFGIVFVAQFLKKTHFLLKLIIVPIVVGLSLYIISTVIEGMMGTAIEEATAELVNTSKTLQEDYENTGGSFVGAVNLDPSLGGIIKTIPQVLNTVFFRPYLWETRNPIMLLSALESFLILLLFLRLVVKSRIIFLFTKLNQNPLFLFSFVFAIILGIIVGLTTFNFGTIVRYKMPGMPFLCLTLLILNKYKKVADIKTEAMHVNATTLKI